jgi:hypothetical protein
LQFKENLLFENQCLKDNLDLHKEKLVFESNTTKETVGLKPSHSYLVIEATY